MSTSLFSLLCLIGCIYGSLALRGGRLLHRHQKWHSSSISSTPNGTRYFTQVLDHFDPSNKRVWRQRFFVNDSFFDSDSGPVFVCVGGEGPPLEPTVSSYILICVSEIFYWSYPSHTHTHKHTHSLTHHPLPHPLTHSLTLPLPPIYISPGRGYR